jgi:hypothetical protein
MGAKSGLPAFQTGFPDHGQIAAPRLVVSGPAKKPGRRWNCGIDRPGNAQKLIREMIRAMV